MQYYDIHTHQTELHAENIAIFSIDIRKVSDVSIRTGTEWIRTNELYAVGVHPWYIDCKDTLSINRLFANVCKLSVHQAIAAIGETGLDKIKAKTTDDFQYQQELFVSHARLSEKVNKPLIIHCVKAWNELMQIHQTLKPSMPWIIHGFRGIGTLAKQLLDAGFYLSFGPRYSSEALKAAWEQRRLLLETDDKKTAICNVYQQAANELSVSVQDLAERIKKSFFSFMNFNSEKK